MKYVILGNSGLRVSQVCLGTMTFGGNSYWSSSWGECRKMFDYFSDRGGNFLDTANFYFGGESESFLGQFTWGRRHKYVIATKYGLCTQKGDVNSTGMHRKNLVKSVEESLKRLKTDYIDLLYIHADDHLTPLEEVMRALNHLVVSGKVLHLGASNFAAWKVAKMQMYAKGLGMEGFSALQLNYSLALREAESELFEMCGEFSITPLAYSPLAGGALTGKYLTDVESGRLHSTGEFQGSLNEHVLNVARAVAEVARQTGHTSSQVALSYVMERSIPVVGARTREQLKENLKCLEVTLSKEQKQALDAASRVEKRYPESFYSSEFIRRVAFDDCFEKVQKGKK